MSQQMFDENHLPAVLNLHDQSVGVFYCGGARSSEHPGYKFTCLVDEATEQQSA
jgi:hypothetical protein